MSNRFALSLVALSLLFSSYSTASADEPFKLGVEQRATIHNDPPPGPPPSYPSYPVFTPPPEPKTDTVPKHPKKKIEGGVHEAPPVQPPLQATIAQPGVLPGEFLGVWRVMGTRSSVEALPQYQAGINNIFSGSTANTWTISGNPQQGYSLSADTGASTQLAVDKVQGTTAFLRYQHKINNTVAQEAVVMQLGPGGATFQGLERISIVKPGEPQPRCKVTYQLNGQRQR